MMNYSDRARDESCRGILTRAIDLLCQESPGEPLSIEALIEFVAERDSNLSVISTKFLGANQDIQFWLAQFLLIRDGQAIGLKSRLSLVDCKQVPEDEIIALARQTLTR